MPDVDAAVEDIAPDSGVNGLSRDDNDTPDELRERAELAAELEALLDADAASGQDNDIEDFLHHTPEVQQTEMATYNHRQILEPEAADAAISAYPGANQNVVQPEPVHEPPTASPHQPLSEVLQEGPLLSNPTDSHIQALKAEDTSIPPENRIKWTPSSPIKKLASQQYLSKAREVLRELAQAQGMCSAKLSCLMVRY